MLPSSALPTGWTARVPQPSDVAALADLLARHETAARGGTSASEESVAVDVTGAGAASRRHVLLQEQDGPPRGWASVQDRAAGRSLASVVVDPDLDPAVADALAEQLLDWARTQALELAGERGLQRTQLDIGAFADDERQQRWLRRAGLEHVRSWWQMSRPVVPEEGEPGAFPEPADDVTIRSVAHEEGLMPRESDLQAMHDILETAFTDHFNYHEEHFDEFVSRLREDPGHRWDHWWIAELEVEGAPVPVGALVGAVTGGTDDEASYVEYLGVLRRARGKGVARSLLRAVLADAAQRGRPSVGIEVDQDSSTGAADLYLSMGFTTKYVTQSWHLDLERTTG